MRVLILGGDGYLGWALAMHLSARGDEVTVVDNHMRRDLARRHDVENLFDVPLLPERCRVFGELSGRHIKCYIGDLRVWKTWEEVFSLSQPQAIIHFAEQPSAPFSMLDRDSAMLTLTNNLTVTGYLIHAVNELAPDAHIVKLGTMGEYGTPNIDIEEGWIDITHKGRSDRFLFPRQASSNYHTTKIMDTDYLWFYVRAWKLAVTDLMQGPVYGIFTDQSRSDARLRPLFAYDEIFGTVINRFVVQAVLGMDLTVYGKGGQTRGYLNIVDTLKCITLAIDSPAKPGELRIFNQFVETFSVNELAAHVVDAAQSIGFKTGIRTIPNPRIEKEEHYYNPTHRGLTDLGLEPVPLSSQVLVEMIEAVAKARDSIRPETIIRNVKWA
jgi:UDP-sulfoquinovose synthase